MPKIKTNRGAAKRFKVLSSGKIKRRNQNMRHILTKKTTKRKRGLRRGDMIDKTNMGQIRRLLPNS